MLYFFPILPSYLTYKKVRRAALNDSIVTNNQFLNLEMQINNIF
ncbi:hypothetical protein BBU94A_AD08 (plasmid) [Borreliella burgdorferi 94a]|nr:hypothetical protein BBU94A_AD08 [Borreliella burgdorferi 94a]